MSTQCPDSCKSCLTFTALCYVNTVPRFLQILSHVYCTLLCLHSAWILANLVTHLLPCVTSGQCPDSCRSCHTFIALCYVRTVPRFLQILSHIYCTQCGAHILVVLVRHNELQVCSAQIHGSMAGFAADLLCCC